MPQLTPGKIVADAWAAYREQCIHPDVGPVQLEENRKCYYAGLLTMLTINDALTTAVEMAEKVSPQAMEVAVQKGGFIMESIYDEVNRYAKGLIDNGPGGLTDQELKVKDEPKEG